MNLTTLAKNILYNKKQNKRITTSSFPSSLTVESEIVDKLKRLEQYTNKNADNRTQGAAGYEYALSAVFLVDKLYLSDPIRGNYQNVRVGTSLQLKPIYQGSRNEKVRFELTLNGKKRTTSTYETGKINKLFLYGVAASFHTHPKYFHNESLSQYTFFSPQDIASLVRGGLYISGLVFDRYLWLACKVDGATMIPSNKLSAGSRAELEGYDRLVSYVKSETWSEYGVMFYEGKLGGKLNRL